MLALLAANHKQRLSLRCNSNRGIDTVTVNVTIDTQNDALVIKQGLPVSVDKDGSYVAPIVSGSDIDGEAFT
jgi:hypothetical protein